MQSTGLLSGPRSLAMHPLKDIARGPPIKGRFGHPPVKTLALYIKKDGARIKMGQLDAFT